MDRLLIANDGSMNILANTASTTQNLLTVSNGPDVLFSISAVGDAYFKGNIVVNNITAKKVSVDNLQMTDKATGQLYCVAIVNGELVKQPGDCSNIQAPSSSSSAPAISSDNSGSTTTESVLGTSTPSTSVSENSSDQTAVSATVDPPADLTAPPADAAPTTP